MGELKQVIPDMPVAKRLELIAFIVSSIQIDQGQADEEDPAPR
jgi:hypothetical protein